MAATSEAPWRQRFRAAQVTLPQWARDEPERCVYTSNATGKWELYTWARGNQSETPGARHEARGMRHEAWAGSEGRLHSRLVPHASRLLVPVFSDHQTNFEELLMAPRCTFCTERPREEVAVLKWRGDDRERVTIPLCMKHHARIAKTGRRGWEHDGFRWKTGWW